jgi:hypothetical protein
MDVGRAAAVAARCPAMALTIGVALGVSLALGSCRPHVGAWQGAADAAADAPQGAARDAARDAAEAGPTPAASEAGPADEEMPPATSDELTERARHLIEAIGKDQSELATDIVFPRDGWLATRDADNPGKDWEKRVQVPFKKALHRLSRRQKGLDRARFVSIELGHSAAQATPKRHGWKKALWVLKGARVTFVVDGRTRTLSIHEMTAWRGAWYVTRLG